jgi:hypothetical protein
MISLVQFGCSHGGSRREAQTLLESFDLFMLEARATTESQVAKQNIRMDDDEKSLVEKMWAPLAPLFATWCVMVWRTSLSICTVSYAERSLLSFRSLSLQKLSRNSSD